MRRDDSAEEPPLNLQGFCVVYLDLLGQSKALRELAAVPLDRAHLEEIVPRVRETFGLRDAVRRWFGGFLGAAGMDVSRPRTTERRDESSLTSTDAKPLFQAFSDCFVLAVPLASADESRPEMRWLRAALVGTAAATLTLLASREALRGGIALAAAACTPDGSIYGPALEQAYYLESRVADYPRIVVGQGVRDFLKEISEDRIATGPATVAQECLDALFQDHDGRYGLDFAGEVVRRHVEEANGVQTFRRALEHVKSACREHEAAGDAKLSARYERLREYLSNCASVWFDDEGGSV